ncbi:MAG: HD-GYP domain-containing protein, partial [Anaerolineae bacterium]
IPLFMLRQAHKLTADLRHRTIDALMAFANSIDARDPSTYQHSQRVAKLAKAVAEQMDLPPDDAETIHLAARIHDLGKVGIPDAILFNPGDLSNGEYDTIKEHPIISANIVESFALFDEGRDMIKHHHERHNGKGYPDRLAAEEIPLGARIIAVADAYDAMTSDRPYRAGLSHEVAVQRIIEERGEQFDPQVVDAFLEVVGGTTLAAGHRRQTIDSRPAHSDLERFPHNGKVKATQEDSLLQLPARSE